MRRVIILVAAAVCVSACWGLGPNPGRGQGIRMDFQTAPYSGFEETKTGYTDERTGSVERIDWSAGDLIRVYSPYTCRQLAAESSEVDSTIHWTDYVVDQYATVNSVISRASVKASDGLNLFFGKKGTHRFRGMYPSPTTASGFSFSEGTVTGVMPASQTVSLRAGSSNTAQWYPSDMRYAMLLAVSGDMVPPFDDNTRVTLPFYPQYTAYEFEISAGSYSEVKVTGFTMTAAQGYLTADSYTVRDGRYFSGTNYDAASQIQLSGTGQTIHVSFSGGLTIKKSEGPVRFMVLALAQTHREITISFDLEGESRPRTLVLKYADGRPLEFDPYKKYRIKGLSFPHRIGTLIQDDIDWSGYVDVFVSEDPILWDSARIFAPMLEPMQWED